MTGTTIPFPPIKEIRELQAKIDSVVMAVNYQTQALSLLATHLQALTIVIAEQTPGLEQRIKDLHSPKSVPKP